jgi:diguanylate cyclase (GGDEF)-like protein/PAS domain S-box-containing protein
MADTDHISKQQDAMQAAWDNSVTGVGFVSPDGRWLRTNAALHALSGRSQSELLAGSLQDLLDFDFGDGAGLSVAAILARNAAASGRRHENFVRADGERGAALVSISPIDLEDGVAGQYLVQIEDVTELMQLSERLASVAPPDDLTGLPSRRSFVRYLSEEVARARQSDELAALLLLRIDDFAQLDETQGREAGERILVTIADALRSRLRVTDVVARVAGDRFGVLLPSTKDPELVARALERLVDELELPAGGQAGAVSATVAVRVIDDTTISGEVLLTELEQESSQEQPERSRTGHPSLATASATGLRGMHAMRSRLGISAVAIAVAASVAYGLIGAVGVNDVRSDGILLPNAAWNGPADLDLAASAGVQLYRARIQLNCVDPGHTGTFDFTTPSASCYGLSYDALVGALAQRGMTLLPILINFVGNTPSPPTAAGSAGSPTITEFAAFAAAAVARYGPTGSFWPTCGCTPHPIQAWEIWNEENNGFWWGGAASASGYAAVFSATRDALRSVDPHAVAVVGGLAFDAAGQSSFVAPGKMIQTLAATNANAFDAVAVHPYSDATNASAAQLADSALGLIRSVAKEVVAATGPGPTGAPRQQIWVTEIGWSDQNEPASTVAAGLQDFFTQLTGGDRAADNIGPVIWYDLRNNSTITTRDDQIGLRYTTATGADAGPKPAWAVFSAAAQSEGTLPLPTALADSGPYVAGGVTAGGAGKKSDKSRHRARRSTKSSRQLRAGATH